MLLMIQVKVNDSIHAIIQTIRINLSRALLIIRGGESTSERGLKTDPDKGDTAPALEGRHISGE